MSDQSSRETNQSLSSDSEAEPSTNGTESQSNKSAADVSKGLLVIVAVIFSSLLYYLVTDRFAPFTSQARIQGYIIGVAPKVSGLITQVHVKNNMEVQQDQLLFEIERSQYLIVLDKALADRKYAQTQVNAGKAAVNYAKAKLQAVFANQTKSQQDINRLSRLHKEDPGTISVRRIELSQANLEQATAQVAMAKADITRAIEQQGGEDDNNNAILKPSEAAVDKAQLDLANTQVKASSRGVITNLTADVGSYANTGKPVMTLLAMHDVWINAEFTENNLGHMRIGNQVEILFDTLPGRVFSGEVSSIGLGVNNGSSQQPGTLPTIENDRDWLRQSQRFPVVINFDIEQDPELREQMRIGGQASVIAYSEDHELIGFLGKLYIRLMSWLSYAY